MAYLALLPVVTLLVFGAWIAWERRRLQRTLDLIEPWQLETPAEQVWYVAAHRKWGLKQRFDPFAD